MATLIDELSNQVQDELPRVVHESFKGLDPIYKFIDQTSINVVQADTARMGYKWQVNHLFGGGLAGLMQQANPQGGDLLSTDTFNSGTKFLDSDDADLTPFPTAVDSPHAGVIKRTLTLHMNTGNFSIPVQWLQMDKLSAAHVKQVAMDIKAVGSLRALMECISFYNSVQNDSNSDAGHHVLAQINGTPTATGTYSIDCYVDGGRISYFRPGMLVEILANSSGPQFGTATDGTDRRNIDNDATTEVVCVIDKVDFINKAITIRPTSATDLDPASAGSGGVKTGKAIADNDWIVWRNAHNYAYAPLVTWGIEDWIKDAGEYLFQTAASTGFEVDLYPHFASQVVAVSAALTDTVLNGYVGGFIDAYAAPDTLLTTWGVTLKYLQAPNASGLDRMLFERTGKALSVHGGFSDVEFSFNGRKMKWLISSMCLPGYMYGLKLRGGNIKRYVPPRVGGTDARIGKEIEFLAPVGGHSGIFKIAHASTGASMNMLEAPFWQYRLCAPIDVRSIKLTGLTEATMS